MKSFYQSGEDFNQWLGNRRWRIFILCVPVILAALILAGAVGIILSRGKNEIQRRYDRIARVSLATGNFEMARVACLRGLAGAKNERDGAQWKFYLALAMNGLGHLQDAQALVAAAAPLEPVGAGSLEAHLLMAQNLLSSLAATNSSNDKALILDTAKHHLLSAIAIDPESVEANELLGRYYINTHQPKKAGEYLLKIYPVKPEIAVLLAVAADAENDHAAAVQWADRALTVFEHNLLQTAPRYNPDDRAGLVRALMIQRKYSANPLPPPSPTAKALKGAPNTPVQDSPGVWLGIVQLLIINNKFGPALQTLEQRMAVSPNPAYQPKLAEICARLAQSFRRDTKDGRLGRLHFIQEGLTNAPDDLQLQLLLVESAHAPDDTGQMAQTDMDQWVAAAHGDTAALWQFVLWTDYRIRGDMTEARKHLETAHQLAPENPLVINDMAVDLASGKREDWERGLKLIQPVVDRYPYDPNYRDTRGQLLALLGRNKEALADLEFAAQRFKNAADTERALARVDAALGIVHHDSSSERLAQVQGLKRDGNYAAAMKILDQALLTDTNSDYATAIADVAEEWVENIPVSQRAQRLQLIEKGLTHDPANHKLQNLLLESARTPDSSGQAAKKFLDQLMAKVGGETAAEWHLALGREAREKGDLDAARHHLEIALSLDPEQTQIQIEMAMVLASGDQADLNRGLQIINSVVDKFPDSPDFRSTRGRILARLGKNSEAVNDLSFAADRLSDGAESADTRMVLAGVYKAMGKSQLEEQQRRLAEQDRRNSP